MSSPAPTPDRPPRSVVAVFLVMVVVALWLLTRRWEASILDRHEFRQLQTALTAFWMQREGIQLNYLTPLFGPPWSIPMEFPIYQACVALWSGLTGMALEQSGRLVSIAFFAATLPALHDLLAVAGLPRSRRLVVLTFVLATPIYLFYARSVLIETTALCFSVWFVALLRRSLESPRWNWILGTTAAAALAALTKITTFAVFCVPAGILAATVLASALRQPAARAAWPPLLTASALPVALALAAAWWWVARGDALKHANPFTGFLASTELQSWNYGTFALRLDPAFWKGLLHGVVNSVLSEGSVAIALLCATFATARARWVALAAAAGYATGPLLFANLYHIHDYYYAANGLLLTGAAGVLVASAWDNPRVPPALRWLALGSVLVFQLQAFNRSYAYYYWKEAPPPPELALVAREAVPADGVILVYGEDWNPLLPYYAQRRAVMVPGQRENETDILEDVLARLPPRRIEAMIVTTDRIRGRSGFIAERTERFGLMRQPFARSEHADLYLAEHLGEAAAQRLAGRRFASVEMLLTAPATVNDDDLREQDLSVAEWAMAQPAPHRGRSRYGISAADVEGRAVINAHAPSELFFRPPPGATRVSALIILPAAAYAAPLPDATDGIVVEILEQQPSGIRRLLVRRGLTPATRFEDRGWQKIEWINERPFTGEIVLKVGPGPAGNPTNDWAAWTQVTIR